MEAICQADPPLLAAIKQIKVSAENGKSSPENYKTSDPCVKAVALDRARARKTYAVSFSRRNVCFEARVPSKGFNALITPERLFRKPSAMNLYNQYVPPFLHPYSSDIAVLKLKVKYVSEVKEVEGGGGCLYSSRCSRVREEAVDRFMST